MKHIAGPATIITLVSLLVIGILEYLKITPGSFVDWGIAIGSFWWLMIITTVPWNMHFRAKETVEDAKKSIDRQINVKDSDLAYASTIAKRYLWVALGLHLFTALALYFVAHYQVSDIGYIGGALAALLTLLRPAIRLHEYISNRLSNIKVDIRYPREDVEELKQNVYELKGLLQHISAELDTENAHSWKSSVERRFSHIESSLEHQSSRIEAYEIKNQKAHEALIQKSENAINELSEDARFLNQARDLIRFIKKA